MSDRMRILNELRLLWWIKLEDLYNADPFCFTFNLDKIYKGFEISVIIGNFVCSWKYRGEVIGCE